MSKQKIAELEEKWKRAIADYKNLERRGKEQQQAFVKFANAVLIEKLLDAVDDLDRASGHLKDAGLNLVVRRFKDILKSEGVEEIETKMREFDPNLMECIEKVSGEKNKVVKVDATGYTLNGKILRPAKVLVGKGDK